MGYCYEGRKLCCDSCGKAGARKKKCPFGYCSPAALCAECRADKVKMLKLKLYHLEHCKKGHEDYAAKRAREAAMLAEGKALRCSAMSLDGDRIHVLFKKLDGSCEGRFMRKSTYDAISLMELATAEDFEKFGMVVEAPGEFSYSKEGA